MTLLLSLTSFKPGNEQEKYKLDTSEMPREMSQNPGDEIQIHYSKENIVNTSPSGYDINVPSTKRHSQATRFEGAAVHPTISSPSSLLCPFP